MKESTAPIFLKEERKKTNESLIAERDKTNQSITNARTEAEDQTDQSVKDERSAADQKNSVTRTQTDSNRDMRGVLSIEQERRHADKAVKAERSGVDAAIEKERDLKNDLMNQLLEQERGQTDKNLQTERTRTDLRVKNSSNLLREEIAEHTKTKNLLTTRDEFMAIFSHDLRNPLGAITMCAEILLEDFAKMKIDPEIVRSIELIKSSSDTALRLIKDILDMERVAERKFELSLEKYVMGGIIEESIRSFAQTAAAQRIDLRAAHADSSASAVCDRSRILQVLSNLISNALKFTPEGGRVVLNVSVDATDVLVSVSDSGPGIPQDKQAKIFERYTQLGLKDRQGLGLGLYIAKMLVELHDGRLWVESKVGEGSTFIFTLPVVQKS